MGEQHRSWRTARIELIPEHLIADGAEPIQQGVGQLIDHIGPDAIKPSAALQSCMQLRCGAFPNR